MCEPNNLIERHFVRGSNLKKCLSSTKNSEKRNRVKQWDRNITSRYADEIVMSSSSDSECDSSNDRNVSRKPISGPEARNFYESLNLTSDDDIDIINSTDDDVVLVTVDDKSDTLTDDVVIVSVEKPDTLTDDVIIVSVDGKPETLAANNVSQTSDNSIICPICGLCYHNDPESAVATHISSLPHQLALMSGRKVNPSPLAIPPSNRGYQLLTRLGWRDIARPEMATVLFGANEVAKTADELNIFPMTNTESFDKTISLNNELDNDEEYSDEETKMVGGGGLGIYGQGRRLPVATVLKRDRCGLGWRPSAGDNASNGQLNSKRPASSSCRLNSKPIQRVTHFGPRDTAAVDLPLGLKRSWRGKGGPNTAVCLDKKYHVARRARERAKDRRLRRVINLADDKHVALF